MRKKILGISLITTMFILNILLFNLKSAKAGYEQQVKINCTGDTSRVCARISLPGGGTGTAYGDKGTILID